MTRPLLLCLLLAPCAAGCKHASSSSSTSHTETSTVTDSTSSEAGATTTTTTVTEQPGKTTTTTEEFGPPEEGGEAPANADAAHDRVPVSDLPPATQGAVTTPRRHGPLVKRTVTVTEHGGETTQTRQEATQQAQGASETHAQAQGDTRAQASKSSAPSGGCIGASWIWGIAVLAGIVGVIYFALKFRRAA